MKMIAKLLATLVVGSFATFLPKHLALVNGKGPFDLTQNSSFCLTANVSTFVQQSQEEGVFAKCDLPAGTLLGEFRGKVYSTPWNVPNDGEFAWKIPTCSDADKKVLRRIDVEAWQKCGDNGFNYIDAETMDDARTNPLRFVQQTRSNQAETSNVDMFIADHRIYYYATQAIETGKEIIVAADLHNWAHARGWHKGMDSSSSLSEGSQGFGSGSSEHTHIPVVPKVNVPRAVAQTGAKHTRTATASRHQQQVVPAPVEAAIPVVAAPPVAQAAPAMTTGGISAAPQFD